MLEERRILWWMAKKGMTFTYLGTIADREGGGSIDIMQKAESAESTWGIQRLRGIWEARGIGWRTKIRLFKTKLRTVLLYGCEAKYFPLLVPETDTAD